MTKAHTGHFALPWGDQGLMELLLAEPEAWPGRARSAQLGGQGTGHHREGILPTVE